MFRNVGSYLIRYLWPPRLLARLSFVWGEWHKSDARERSLLLLVFAPMMACILGLLFSVAGFVLFVLPSFILKVFGWLLLAALFGGAGVFFHEKIKGKPTPSRGADPDPYDIASEPQAPEEPAQESVRSRWFKNMKWPR